MAGQSRVDPLENEDTFQTSDPDSDMYNVTNVVSTEEGLETASRFVNEKFDHPITRKYMLMLMQDASNKKLIDYTYGPRFEGDTLMVGDKPLTFDSDGSIVLAGITYAPTEGLYELVFKRIPDDEMYSEEDLRAYKDILLKTNAHKKGYKFNGNINRNRSLKYKNVIEQLFPKQLYGKGLVTKSLSRPDPIYWNNVNELVDRLRLLTASAEAGSSAHKNEIINIIEELRESGFIKGRGNYRYWSLVA